jgi:hypothetical protein
MDRMANNSNSREDMDNRSPPIVTWEVVLLSKIGISVINNGETTVVIIRKTVGICNNSHLINTNRLSGVVGIAVASVAEVAVGGVEGWWVTDTRIVESENRVHFSLKEGERIFTLPVDGF